MALHSVACAIDHQCIPNYIGKRSQHSYKIEVSCEGSLAKYHFDIKKSQISLAGKGHTFINRGDRLVDSFPYIAVVNLTELLKAFWILLRKLSPGHLCVFSCGFQPLFELLPLLFVLLSSLFDLVKICLLVLQLSNVSSIPLISQVVTIVHVVEGYEE